MHGRISTNVGAPIIKSYGTEAITRKSTRITKELRLTGIPDIDLAHFAKVLWTTMIRLSIVDS